MKKKSEKNREEKEVFWKERTINFYIECNEWVHGEFSCKKEKTEEMKCIEIEKRKIKIGIWMELKEREMPWSKGFEKGVEGE